MGWAQAKWIVDSLAQKIGQSPNNMRAFTATRASDTSVSLTFLEPEDSYMNDEILCSVKGVIIRMSTEKYPMNPNEGELVIDNTILGAYNTTPLIVENLENGETYYFSAFPYSTQRVYNLSKDTANRAVVE